MSLLPHHTSDSVCALCAIKVQQAHPLLVDWFNTHVKPLFPDAHISWAFRNQDQQNDCVAEGKSNQPWPTSPHNQAPALALDLFEINLAGKAVWDVEFFQRINEMNKARNLLVVWGGDFIKLHDYDHFQLKTGLV